ncbi:MAG: IPT/TIG domain-containing protein [Mycobacteriales bacterium]
MSPSPSCNPNYPPPPPSRTIYQSSPTSGPASGGTVVTITGPNMQNQSGVVFGALSSTDPSRWVFTPGSHFTVLSDTMAQVTTPAQRGRQTASVFVVGKAGWCKSWMTGEEFYYQHSAVIIKQVNPNQGPQAGGTYVVINGEDFAGVTQVLFGSQPAQQFTYQSETEIDALSPPGAAGVVDVRVETNHGENSPGPADQFTYN